MKRERKEKKRKIMEGNALQETYHLVNFEVKKKTNVGRLLEI